MSRTIKVILAVIFVLLVTFSAISIFQDLGKRLKVDLIYHQSPATAGDW